MNGCIPASWFHVTEILKCTTEKLKGSICIGGWASSGESAKFLIIENVQVIKMTVIILQKVPG